MNRRGTTLLEAMVGLTVLLVGLLGMLQAQIFGMRGDQAARAATHATTIAQDLLAALDREPLSSPYLTANIASPTAPAGGFGPLLYSLGSAVFHDGAAGVPVGALSNSAPDLELDSNSHYHRRWVVWWYAPAGSQYDASGYPPAMMISVSVVYREASSPNPKEVVLYEERSSPSAVKIQVN